MGRPILDGEAFLPDHVVDEFRNRLVYAAGMMTAEQVRGLCDALMAVVRRKQPEEPPHIDLHA